MSKLKRNASNILSKKSVGIHTLRQPGRKCHICCFQFEFVQNYDSRKLRIYSFFDRDLKNYPPEILIIMIYFFIR